MNGFDVIGDIHGHSSELKELLMALGYQTHGCGFRRSDRRVVFVGDFVDRGPGIGQVIEIVRAMVEAGDALAVMGNHEYNAIAFHTARPGMPNEWFRPHSDKNLKQHQATLDQLSSSQIADAVAWFKTLPTALDLGGIRVAHASWQTSDIDCIRDSVGQLGGFTPEFLEVAGQPDSDLNKAIENVLKGPELRLPSGCFITDKAGHERSTTRIKWYEDGSGRTYRQHHLGSDIVPDVEINTHDLTAFEAYSQDAVPVFVGHYWLTGRPVPLANNVACTDYSVAKAGKLVAYRWDGEAVLNSDKFFWVAN
ncbi:MAG TPA: diadenosine tetraphosphatase [Planctomycetaceae bacterium]|nr:diadenosine tetraphosphatase [Planctomycetaceae bacterium]